MSRVDLNKNRPSLLEAHKAVSDINGSINWAVYGYEGNTNVLKLVEKGDGGIEEMVDELNSGKIMYAYCRVKDPNTGLDKFVLINWQGEGAPDSRKGTCTNHVRDVTSLLRGAHVTITARSEEDVEEDVILDKVSKSSGANYSFHKEKARPVVEAGPVGSVYQRTFAQREIDTNKRDKFWENTEKEEKARQQAEIERKKQIQVQTDQERRDREEREAAERDRQVMEKMKKINEMKRAEREANKPDKEAMKKKWENDNSEEYTETAEGENDNSEEYTETAEGENDNSEEYTETAEGEEEQREAYQEEEERRKRSEQARKERAAEAKSLVSQRGNVRSKFESQPRSQFDDEPEEPVQSGPPPPRKLRHGFGEDPHPQQYPEEEETPASPVHRPPARLPEPEPEPEPELEPEPEPEPEPAPVSRAPPQLPQTRNLLKEGLPPRQDSDEEEDQDWNVSPGTVSETPPAPGDDEEEPAPAAPVSAPVSAPAPQVAAVDDEQIYENQEYGGETPSQQQKAGDQGLCARALYDYQAADDTEITFDPDDIITNIEQIDEGWWTGYAPDGKHGMFPANYVELLS